jgi:hypothetical protein
MNTTTQSNHWKTLHYIALCAMVILSLFYGFILYQVLMSGWSFFGTGAGDVIIVALLTTIYIFIFTLFHFSKRFHAPWLNIFVIAGTAIYLYVVPQHLKVIDAENDQRAQELRAYFPKSGERKAPPPSPFE